MAITVNVNGRPAAEAFLIAPVGGATFPVPISLQSDDGAAVYATLRVQATDVQVELSQTTLTTGSGQATLTARSGSKRKNDIVLQVEVGGNVAASVSFTALTNPRIRFQGRFEVRFATNMDFYNHPRGTSAGWTWALEGEPDFVPATNNVPLSRNQPVGRALRFNDPVALRTHVPPIGVAVTAIEGDTDTGVVACPAGDPVIGEKVDLGPDCYFASNFPVNPADPPPFERWPDGREPLDCFVLTIGSRFTGTSKELTDRPQANGLQFLSAQERQQYGIVPLNVFRDQRRHVLLDDYQQLPEPRDATPAGRNLATRISHLGGSSQFGIPSSAPTLRAGYEGKEEYRGEVNDAVQITPNGSSVMEYFRLHDAFAFFAKFFNFHSDELCGRVDGTLAVMTTEQLTRSAPAPLALAD